MIITAKFASTCSCCRQPISAGSKIEWSKGSPAKHTACSGAVASSDTAAPARRSYYRAARGRWNGCSCGAREMSDGSLSSNACASCRFDNE